MRRVVLFACAAALLIAAPARAMSDAEAKAACTALAQLADQGELSRLAVRGRDPSSAGRDAAGAGWTVTAEEEAELRASSNFWFTGTGTVYQLRLSPTGPPTRFASFFAGGTCQATHTRNVELLLKSRGSDDGVDPVPDPEERVRWAYWGGGDYPVLHRGRHFMVTADLSDPNRVAMVSWIRPDGRQRPLCLLSVENLRPKVVSARRPALCEGIAGGKLAPLEWKPIAVPLPHGYSEEFQQRYGRIADGVELLAIDVDGDGRTENIGRFGYTSSSGCGSTTTWLSVLSEDRTALAAGALAARLGEFGGDPVDVYQSGGRYYIASLSARAGGSVAAIRNGRTEAVCEFRPRTRTSVSEFFGVGP